LSVFAALQASLRERQNLRKFKAALASPPTTTLTIPATALFALVSRAGNAALGSALTVTGPTNRTIGVPALVTGQRKLIGKLERGTVVTINAALDLYVETGLGSYKRVLKGA
jgi:hypothetical protein